MAAANNRWRREMLTYFCFTLPSATAPIGFLYVAKRVIDGSPLTIPGLVADGGILTIAIGLNASALSRLMWSGTKWLELKVVFASLASLAMLFGSYFYGMRYVHRATDSVVFVDLCLLVSIVSTGIATFCRFLPEDDQ
jgi:hypothetical protein